MKTQLWILSLILVLTAACTQQPNRLGNQQPPNQYNNDIYPPWTNDDDEDPEVDPPVIVDNICVFPTDVLVQTVTLTTGAAAIIMPAYSTDCNITYSISPALPAGLSINAITGMVSGTPTVASTLTSYTVSYGGKYSTTLKIQVISNAPKNLAYDEEDVAYVKGTEILANTASVEGTISSFAISPSLPTGLVFNTTNGTISGTPTVVSSQTSYKVTVTGTGGSTYVYIKIQVKDIAPATLTYTTETVEYVKSTAISPNSPTVTGGAVTSYTVSPALPAGLSLNATSGVITGTPTVASVAGDYVVTASNSGGFKTITLKISVKDNIKPSSIAYPSNPAIYQKDVEIAENIPTYTGGLPTEYTIEPSLPAGLEFDSATGTISGTPTAVSTKQSYWVEASNEYGVTAISITIAVSVSLPYTEDFSITSNGGLNSNWKVQYGGFAVAAATSSTAAYVYPTSSTVNSIATLQDLTVTDVHASLKIKAATANYGHMGIVGRYNGNGADNEMYLAAVQYLSVGYYVALYKIVNGIWYQWQSSSSSWVSVNYGDFILISAGTSAVGTLKFNIVGTALAVFFDGSLKISATDSSFSSGSVGIRGWAGQATEFKVE